MKMALPNGKPPTLAVLRQAYSDGASPVDVITEMMDRIDARGDDAVWIYRPPRQDLIDAARRLKAEYPDRDLPLWGVPFTVKDCNDVPGMPTTNALPQMAYMAETTGPAINRLLRAGAICLGKTNMDQFGIGLVGMRSPYGAPSCVFDDAYISGGSSSGSAVATALGLGSFSIGNDAAGSGRVPAGFNNVVGIKPTPGLVSNSCVSGGGCVKTLETVTVFALTVADGLEITRMISGFDIDAAFSSPLADSADLGSGTAPDAFSFGVPAGEWLRFFEDTLAEAGFAAAQRRLEDMGGTAVPVDFAAFDEAQRSLYDGPWVAERALTLDPIIEKYADHIHPVTRDIVARSSAYSAMDTFRAIHRIAELKRDTRHLWQQIDVLAVPTTPTIYRKDEITAEPVLLNSRLGIYTNFVNLMGLCGVATPAGFRDDGLPHGVTFLAPGFHEGVAARIAAAFHAASHCGTGVFTDFNVPPSA